MGREQNFVLNNKYDQSFSYFELKMLFQSDLYDTFPVINVKVIVIFLNFVYYIKDNNTSTNWQEITIFSHQ